VRGKKQVNTHLSEFEYDVFCFLKQYRCQSGADLMRSLIREEAMLLGIWQKRAEIGIIEGMKELVRRIG
jgi:hypothetical protein